MSIAEHEDSSLENLDVISRRMLKAWMAREPQREIPWTPLRRPLREAKVALISSAGLALKKDPPFDQEGERRNPWWGDPSYRVIPRGTTAADVGVYHLHVDPAPIEHDLDCALPLTRLDELVAGGEVGAAAESHYSFMGYLLNPAEFIAKSVPAMIERLRAEEVDAVLLVPV